MTLDAMPPLDLIVCGSVAVNGRGARVGKGGGKLDYAGDSAIIDPMGEVLASGSGTEALLVADIDPARVAAVRAEFPFLADRAASPGGT